jgi:hypothetical protein
MDVNRRELLATVGTGALAGALAGCSGAPTDGGTTTPPPVESSSRLRIRVENEGTEVHTITFRIRVTRQDGPDQFNFFTVDDVEPGQTRTPGARPLPPGRYALTVELPLGSPTIQWTGDECSEKLVVIRFTESGIQLTDRCPAEE